MEATLRLRYRSQTMLTTVTYGVTDRLDVGATIPFLENTLEASVEKRILRYGTASNPTIHSFDGQGSDTATATGGGTASGIGDIRVQAKYNFVRRPSWGVSGLWDVRLPTGDTQKLTGTGTVFTRWLGVVSAGNRTFSAHVNGGMTFASGSFDEEVLWSPAFEFNYTVGFDWSVIQRATVSSDVMVRHRPSGRSLMAVGSRNLYGAGGTVTVPEFFSFQHVPDGFLGIAQSAFGAKVAVWRTLLVSANVLVGLRNIGLMHKPALNLGLEYTF
jgi:hypothetical protein